MIENSLLVANGYSVLVNRNRNPNN